MPESDEETKSCTSTPSTARPDQIFKGQTPTYYDGPVYRISGNQKLPKRRMNSVEEFIPPSRKENNTTLLLALFVWNVLLTVCFVVCFVTIFVIADSDESNSDDDHEYGIPMDAALETEAPEATEIIVPMNCDEFWYYYEGSCHRLLSDSDGWTSAVDKCKEHDASLAVPRSLAEWQLMKTIADGDEIWVGLTDQATEDEWLDSQGVSADLDSIIPIFLWQRSEPNDGAGDKDCLAMNAEGRFKADTCEGLKMTLCQKEPIL